MNRYLTTKSLFLSSLLGTFSLFGCTPDAQGPGLNCGENCDESNEAPEVIPASPWISCWVEDRVSESDIDPTGDIYCSVDSEVAFTGDERVNGLNAAEVLATFSDGSIVDMLWTPGRARDEPFHVGSINPTFDRTFPITLKMSVNTFGGHKYRQNITLNTKEEATYDSPVVLNRPYDLWNIALQPADGVRVLKSEFSPYEIPMGETQYQIGNGDEFFPAMTISTTNLPLDTSFYIPVEAGFTGSVTLSMDTAYKPSGEPREYYDFDITISKPGVILIGKDGVAPSE